MGALKMSKFRTPLPLWAIICSEWKYWLPGAILSFLLASIFISGWPSGLIPNLSFPYNYCGDSLFAAWDTQRLMEGWIYNNSRSGYPFGSNFLDYPGSDLAHFLLLKWFTWITGTYYAAINLYFLVSFPVTFIISFIVTRAIQVNRWFSLAAAMLFVFLPFHFMRLPHLFYTWYCVVPLFFYISFCLCYYKKPLNKRLLILLIILASFGIYYALFGVILLAIGGIAG